MTFIMGHIALMQESKKVVYLGIYQGISRKGYDAIGVFIGEYRESEHMPELDQKVKFLNLKKYVVFRLT